VKRQRVHYGNRYHVKLWTPPVRILDVAHDRTEGMAGFFLATGSSDYVRWRNDLYRLCASCYMQGVNDAVDSVDSVAKSLAEKEKILHERQ